MRGATPPFLQFAFMAWCSVKAQGQLYFYLYQYCLKKSTALAHWNSETVGWNPSLGMDVGGCIQKFPDWPPGARTANGTALCHWMQFFRCFVSQSSKCCRHNPFCCFSTSFYFYKYVFRYRLSPESFGYTLAFLCSLFCVVM
jgi:hypothetical protein